MIYKGCIKNNSMEEVDASILSFFQQYEPEEFEVRGKNKQELKELKEQQDGFISGEMKELNRNSKNIINRDALIIDIDDCYKSESELLKWARELKNQFIAYPTISNGLKGVRYRLIFPLSKPVDDAATYSAMIQFFSKKVLRNIIRKPDTSNESWAQLMLLPCITEYNTKDKIVVNNGEPYSYDAILKAMKANGYLNSKENNQGDAIEMNSSEVNELVVQLVKEWAEMHQEELQDYDFFIIPFLNIKHNYQTKHINYNTAIKCLCALALGNGSWERDNVEKFNKEKDKGRVIKGTPIESFFPTKLEYELNIGIPERLLFGDELVQALELAVEQEYEMALHQSNKTRDSFRLSTAKTVNILMEYIPFCEIGGKLFMYQADKGIWTMNENDVARLIAIIQPNASTPQIGDISNQIRLKAEQRSVDTERYLVPCKNGIYNTETKTLEAFSPDYVFLSKLATDYIPTIEMPLLDGWWTPKDFIKELSNKDTEIETLLYQVINDAVHPNHSRKKAIWLYGSGSNGKSTYQDVIKNIVGNDCYSTLKFNEFSERFRLHSLIGKSVNIGDDVNAGVRVDDSSNFNSIVTHDSVTIEEKYKSPYHTKLYCTLIQSTNEMPTIRNKTNGTYRRMLIVPFENQFEDTSENWKIKEEYIKSKEVLEWILAKALSMDFEQFINPNASKALLEEYKADNDAILAFKQDVFDVLDAKGAYIVPLAPLFDLYTDYCKKNKLHQERARTFNKVLEKLLGDEWYKGTKHFNDENTRIFTDTLCELNLNKIDEYMPKKMTQKSWVKK